MGEPFSIATGVAGIVSLGLTVCDGLHRYFSAIKDRKDDLAIVTQNLALFKFHIFTVQSSASKLVHRHSPAIDGLQLSLINCEMQLKCLETLLNELLPTQDPSPAKDNWRKQKLIVRYPFDRKKLVQLEEYLSRANTTLSSFIHALNLEINIRMMDNFESFRASLDAVQINTQFLKSTQIDTQRTLRTINSRLDIFGPEVKSSTPQRVQSRVEDVVASNSNINVLNQTAVGVTETKTSFSGNEGTLEALTDAHSTTPRYLQDTEMEEMFCKRLADMDCTCGASNKKTRNHPGRTYRFWGGLTVSRHGDVRANHRPGCIFFYKSKKNVSRTSVTYFGLLSWFSQLFTITLTQEYLAGPYSVSFGLQPCNIVKSCPAFRVFQTQSQRHYQSFNYCANGNCLDSVAESIIKELRIIYESGKASPFDVDQDGNNAAHMCLTACLWNGRRPSGTAIDSLCKMLRYLADIGVPIAASNFDQCNILTLSLKSHYVWTLPRLYKLVKIHDSNFYDTELAHNRLTFPYKEWSGDQVENLKHLDMLCKYPEICEDIGFSDLFLAAITKDHGRLQAILAEEDRSINISQTDLYGRNILHVSCNWPSGLKLLLQRQDIRPLMELAPGSLFPLSPLDYVLFYSKIHCNAPDQWTECDKCTCYVAVQLLLEADCKVTVTYERRRSLANCSLKARKLFFKHLRDRRQRLRNIALIILPEAVRRQYGVSTNFLPDKTSIPLWNELQQAQGQQDRRVWLPDSLDPCENGQIMPESLFEFPHQLQVVELALDYGFTPRDENGVQTLLSGSQIIPDLVPQCLEVSMKHLDWLLRQNLSLECSLATFRFSIFHRIAIFIGKMISFKAYRKSNLLHWDACFSELRDSTTLLPAICDNKAQCNIPCPCSAGIFTRPLALILPAFLQGQDKNQFRNFFSYIGEHIKTVASCIDLLNLSRYSSEYLYMAKCAFHILTMMSLGARHLPICLTEPYDDLKDLMSNEEKEWVEILDEDRELIIQLEALDEEFGHVFSRQNVSIVEFLWGYWLRRMGEVFRELNKPLTHHDRYKLLEAGVVLEEDNADGSACCEDMTYLR